MASVQRRWPALQDLAGRNEGPIRINTAPIEDLNNDHVLSPDGRTLTSARGTGISTRFPSTAAFRSGVSPDQAPGRQYIYYLHGVSPDGQTLSYVGYEKSAEGKWLRASARCRRPAARSGS